MREDVKLLVDRFSTESNLSTRSFVCLSTQLASICPPSPYASRSIGSPSAAASGVLARLRCGHTYAQLAAGFRIGTSTVYRCITEAVGVLAAHAPGLPQGTVKVLFR